MQTPAAKEVARKLLAEVPATAPQSAGDMILQRQIFDCVIPYLERTDCHTLAGNVRELFNKYTALRTAPQGTVMTEAAREKP
jgi:hypothetical protein